MRVEVVDRLAHLSFTDGTPDLLVWAPDRHAYGKLCRLLTIGKRRAEKGECHLTFEDFVEHQSGLLAAIVLPPLPPGEGRGEGVSPTECARRCWDPLTLALPPPMNTWEPRREKGPEENLRELLADRLSLVVSRVYGCDDETHVRNLAQLSRDLDIPLLATNGVHYHDPASPRASGCAHLHPPRLHDSRRRLQALSQRRAISEVARADAPAVSRIFRRRFVRGIEIAERCTFSWTSCATNIPMRSFPLGRRRCEYLVASDLDRRGRSLSRWHSRKSSRQRSSTS